MTPEELEALVARADTRGLIDACKKLSEAERKKLSKTAQQLHKEIDNAAFQTVGNRQTPLERLKSWLGKRQVDLHEQRLVANLALFAVGPLSQVKRAFGRDEFILEIMQDRKPDWIDDWVASAIAGESGSIHWETFWTLYRDGLCRKPETDEYYRFFANSMIWGYWQGADQRKLATRLEEQPELLEDVWKLFEVETDAFTVDWRETDAQFQGWGTAVIVLSKNGKLDRDRLLDSTLAGLSTGFKQNVLSGFSGLHERLEPTTDELALRQATYCDLVSVSQNSVVSFAIKMLKKVDQAKKLDDALFLRSIGPVFRISTKGPAKTTLTLLKKVAKRGPQLHQQIAMVLLDALEHPAEDVQANAVEQLAKLSDELETAIVQNLQERVDDVVASVRPRLLAIIRDAGGSVEVDQAEAARDFEQRLEASRQRAEALPREWADRAGVREALNAINDKTWPPPLDFELLQVPVLSGLESVTPIETVDELLDAVALAVEEVSTGNEVERILDGLSRLCDQRPDTFERRAAPILKRLGKIKDSEKRNSIGVELNGIPELPRVLTTWLGGDLKLTKPTWGRVDLVGIRSFLNTRLEGLRARIASATAAPLLAAPTHEGGWLDPRTVVDRWLEMQEAALSPPKFELILCLLRLAPDGRAEALEKSEPITDDKARALRWALGADEGPAKVDRKRVDIWIAAARSRGPRESYEELKLAGANPTEPNTVHAATHAWTAKVRPEKIGVGESARIYRFEEIDFHTEPKAQGVVDTRPTALFYKPTRKYMLFGTTSPWIYDWIGTIWPANIEPYCLNASQSLVGRLDSSSSTWEPNHAFFPVLFQADRPWANITTLTAILGAIGRDQDTRGLAIDALIEAIADGRATAESLGAALSSLAVPNWLKLNRLADSMAEVARISPLHARTVLGTVETLVVAWEEIPRDAHHALALVNELMAETRAGVSDAMVARLSDIKGSSKTAKLAKSIIAFEAEESSPSSEEARLLILESRVDRAERWAQAAN